MITDIDRARHHHARLDAKNMIRNLPDLGESLHNAAIDLSRDCSLERVDQMLGRVKSAESSLVHLRKSLVQGQNG